MTARIIVIPLGPSGTLELPEEVFKEHLVVRDATNLGADGSGNGDEPLLDADQLGALLSVPPSWLEQKARERVIPSLEFGRWRRFKRREVEAAVRALRS